VWWRKEGEKGKGRRGEDEELTMISPNCCKASSALFLDGSIICEQSFRTFFYTSPKNRRKKLKNNVSCKSKARVEGSVN